MASEGRTGRTWCCWRFRRWCRCCQCRRCCRCRAPRIRGGCGRGPLSPLLAPPLPADVTAMETVDWLSGLIGSQRPRARAPPLGAGAPHWRARASQGPAHPLPSGAVPAGPARRISTALRARALILLYSAPFPIPHTGTPVPQTWELGSPLPI